MKFFIWKYNPTIIHISSFENITIIIPKAQKDEYIQKNIHNFIAANSIDFENVYNIMKIQEVKNAVIDDIFTLDEQCMDWVGILKQLFVKKKSKISDVLFKDKYYMRSLLKEVVREPYFVNVTEDNYDKIKISEGIVKPRRADSAKGLYRFAGKIDYDKLRNLIGYTGEDEYIAEEYINYDKMFTVDGYTDLDGHERYFSHEYDRKISDFKLNPYMTAYTNHFYYTDKNKLKDLFRLSKKVIEALATRGEITPFHIEWFYIEKEDKFVFTEIGKRFGGVRIPELIKNSFDIDIIKEYWALQQGHVNDISSGIVYTPKGVLHLIYNLKMDKK